jgi:hypothetical protein
MEELTDTIQKKTILAIMAADISQDDWQHPIINAIWQPYARGYLDAKIGALNDASVCFSDELFREELLKYCQNDIWN